MDVLNAALQGKRRIQHAQEADHGSQGRNVHQPQTANDGYRNHAQGKPGNRLNIAAEKKHEQDNKKGDVEHGRSLPHSAPCHGFCCPQKKNPGKF